jgi:hypothetical protein
VTGKDDDSPWLKGVRGVKGIVPPGRRLSPPTEKRPARWSASGVTGVRPPGGHPVGEGPATEWVMRTEKKKKRLAERANRQARDQKLRGKDAVLAPLRPTAGIETDVFAGANDPKGIEAFLKELNDFIVSDKPGFDAAEDVAQLITQSRAPFEIVVAFALLTGIVGTDEELREQFALSLERGANVFYNLARRIDPNVQVPRGLMPHVVDAIFWDLPESAHSVPFAFATHAFLEMSQLLERTEPEYDDRLQELRTALYERYIASRSIGDASLEKMFPWSG